MIAVNVTYLNGQILSCQTINGVRGIVLRGNSMMLTIKDMTESKEDLAYGLRHNALLHRNYKLYTSTEIALAFLLDGYLMLSDGTMWNDTPDSKQMKHKMVYGKCFSWSTRENIAMWMLYGDHCGKNGVALSFRPSVLKSICDAEEIEIVKVIPGESIQTVGTIQKEIDFDLYFTDVLYEDAISANRFIVSYNEQHVAVARDILEHEDVFRKRYEWKYENECRLIVKPTEAGTVKINNAKLEVGAENEKLEKESSSCMRKAYVTLRIKIPKYRELTEDRFIRSPVYQGKVLYGVPSTLYGQVNWELN